MIMTRAFAMAALAASASAHFTLDWPATRGFNEDIENQFCGGFSNAGARSSFPLGAAGVNIDSTHDTANVIVLISFDANPQTSPSSAIRATVRSSPALSNSTSKARPASQ
ncbi:nucleoporin-interacting protein NIC96, putative [Rhizoctonia solani AG-3 Rhs1AP]|uniref:Nucleoporin-interacting protein NIC96, putative n=1 Tax=Rhizoctonia solani AG-3 Rhs1AP TaxID=1086054 RepID=X8IXS8_9AGAM|nr:nucleoporin-interacting protein NIC96, putative [Rhizoctonia solani AG-3 Rhs1AP]